ncbi:MAG: large conductance mechanosensitive channel protein MscL [Flavobacteriales bacterium]
MLQEFKAFALRGNLIDMAVAFVMGAAFGKIVSAFVEGVVMPLVGLLTFGQDFTQLVWQIKPPSKDVLLPDGTMVEKGTEAVVIRYGELITIAIDFILVAFVMFLLVKGINRMRKNQPAEDSMSAQEKLLIEIRDELRKSGNS